jgi:hypothetical protein
MIERSPEMSPRTETLEVARITCTSRPFLAKIPVSLATKAAKLVGDTPVVVTLSFVA